MTEFKGVAPALGEALNKREYTTLTPVQNAVLEDGLGNVDMLVSAQTGSGKTVAFGLAIAPTLLEGADRLPYAKVPLALVVAPTRELALQVKRELEWLYEMTGAIVASCVGGMDMRQERRTLERGAHIVVGTPGRLCDHISRGSFNTSGLKAVVLDEADEMLDLGFREELEIILNASPKDRRTLMFSATVPRTIANMAKRYQNNAVRISTKEEEEQHIDIEYRALTVSPKDRENAIINVLRYYEAKTALVFCATRATVNHMTSRFNNRGFSVVALSGELSQSQRTHALQAMRDGRARVCIATDVAARGIDLPSLELVIHADVPKGPEILKHRSGRTGRAGRKGVSVLIVPFSARKRTERLLRSANIEASWAKPPSAEEVKVRDRERILVDPTLSEPIRDDEIQFAQELLALHGPEQIAAAFLRLHHSGQSAPEELLDTGPDPRDRGDRGDRGDRPDRKEKRRDDFTGGVWVSLSVGRSHQAEPRWILPMMCKVGGLNKTNVGAIKIHQEETHVELSPDCVDKFFEAVGPSRKMEKSITVDRLAGIPNAPREKREYTKEKSKPKSYPEKATFDAPSEEVLEEKTFEKAPYEKKPKKKTGDRKSTDKKPWDKKTKARKDKKAKAKFAKDMGSKASKARRSDKSSNANAKSGETHKPGSSPLKRKKPKTD